MNDLTELVLRAAIIGSGGAALMDLWGAIARRLLGIQGLDYALLGRWIGHLPHGRFVHERIAAAEPVPGERALGWIAHYAIGIGFALVLLAIWGLEWGRIPAIGPAMLVGMGTILAPWLVMQPAMGAGIAGSRTPNPAATRARNLVTHAVYGIGLYGSAVGLTLIWP
jgi:hypothetical protein